MQKPLRPILVFCVFFGFDIFPGVVIFLATILLDNLTGIVSFVPYSKI